MNDTLLVPMELDALVVNNQLKGRDSFRWWTFNYNALDTFKSPEPLACNQYITDQKPGVYLHWTLPRSLRSGKTGAGYPLVPNRWLIVRCGHTAGQPLAGWVLESDCPASPGQSATFTSAYLIDPSILALWKDSHDSNRENASVLSSGSANPRWVNLGIPFDMGKWTERAPNTMFLTAVAPGNGVFSTYVPHNRNVFSFYDDLTGIDQDTLSYFVTGWYSDVTKDIVTPGGFTGGRTVAEALKYLEWTLIGNASPDSITRSVYTGMVFSLEWSRTGAPPAQDPLQTIRETKKINVAIANSTIDAFSKLIGQQLKNNPDSSRIVALLRALQYDQLQVLNEINGDALLESKVRDAWFGSKSGGTRWTIVAQGADDESESKQKEVELTPEEAAWLLQLNIDQHDLDKAIKQLCSLQWELNAAWWKQGHVKNVFPNTSGYSDQDFQPLFDTTNSDSLFSRVLAQLKDVNDKLDKAPQPVAGSGMTEQEALLKGIADFAQKKGLTEGKLLKAIKQPRYWKANNPVVVISGVEPSSATDPDERLTVRTTSQLITALTVGGKSANALTVKIPALSNQTAFPDAVASLFLEFFLLDPGNTDVIASRVGQTADVVKKVMSEHNPENYTGTLPELSLECWSQPWNPMYLEWKAVYIHIPSHRSNGQPNWRFNGTDYVLDQNTQADKETEIGGISLLSPNAQFVFGARLKKFVETYGDDEKLQKTDEWIRAVDGWKFLAQELVNFDEMLAQRDQRAFRRPGAETINIFGREQPLAGIIGYPDAVSPVDPAIRPPAQAQGSVSSVPFILNDVQVDFYGVRQGQLYFTDLILYDKFGRVLPLILPPPDSGLYDAMNFPLICDSALTVDKNMTTENIAAPVQLPPRLLQHARLDAFFIDQHDDTHILGLNEKVNPLCGWLIPSHLDNGILLYTPDGRASGELQLIKGVAGGKMVQWSAPPHTDLRLEQLESLAPHLYGFVKGIEGRSEADFLAFIQTIDSTLWTIDPLGSRSDRNLSVLVGRPLALVRLQLQLSLDGKPLADAGWASTFTPTPPEFVNVPFSVRLGDLATRNDGVIGYYTERSYGQFNSVVAPSSTGQNYVAQIGSSDPSGNIKGNYIDLQCNADSRALVTVLFDPRASIHAVTGILPVKEIMLPTSFIDTPLSAMEVSFHAGPLVTRTMPASIVEGHTSSFTETIDYLPLAEQNGNWAWWEKSVKPPLSNVTWQGYDLAKALSNADFRAISSVREGVLQLVTKIEIST
ncbi:MAG: hypothetical protein HGA97_09525 [Chlorobiaceae bacterium]|nr:hypothetical protein [Chlorobiaceae bacterium]